MLSFVAQNSLGQRACDFAQNAAIAASVLYACLFSGVVVAADSPSAANTMQEERETAEAMVKIIDEDRIQANADAEALVGEILSGDDPDEMFPDWTNRVLEQAMTRARAEAVAAAGGSSSDGAAAPLSAERDAGAVASSLTGDPGSSQVLIFMSLSVPKPSWRQWAAEAARAGVPLVVRGPSPEGLRATIEEIGDRLGGEEAGVAIDPRLFRLFDIDRVPAVVALPLGVPPCRSRGCADDEPPPFDRITGNIGLVAALAAIAAEGDAGVGTARNHLKKLGVRP